MQSPIDPRSESVLATVCPKLADRVRAAAASLGAKNTFILVVSGLRTAAEQNALYAQGRSTSGHIVTNAKAGESMHNYGIAVDVVPFISGIRGPLNWKVDTEQFQAMVKALKDQGLVWGGDWKSLKDFDHFQLDGLPNSPTDAMRDAYTGGTPQALQAFWRSIGAAG